MSTRDDSMMMRVLRAEWVECPLFVPGQFDTEMFVWTPEERDHARRTLAAWQSPTGEVRVLVSDGAGHATQAWAVLL